MIFGPSSWISYNTFCYWKKGTFLDKGGDCSLLSFLPSSIYVDLKISVRKKQQLSIKCIMAIYKIEKIAIRASKETKNHHHQSINIGDSWICR
jgi:hypothetical protein